MKKILIALSLFICGEAMAKQPVSATCNDFRGSSVWLKEGDISVVDDRISKKLTFVFDFVGKKMLDNEGVEYALYAVNNHILAFAPLPLSEQMVTFYPGQNAAFISKHTYWNPEQVGMDFDMAISGWTMVGKCNFEYSD